MSQTQTQIRQSHQKLANWTESVVHIQADITQDIAQAAVDAMKAVVQVMAAVMSENSLGVRMEPVSMWPTLGIPKWKQSTLHGGTTDKYMQLKIFKLEVNDILKP